MGWLRACYDELWWRMITGNWDEVRCCDRSGRMMAGRVTWVKKTEMSCDGRMMIVRGGVRACGGRMMSTVG